MKNHEFILDFVRSCASGNLGSSECNPVFMLGGIVLAVVILATTLAVLMLSRVKTQSVRKAGR